MIIGRIIGCFFKVAIGATITFVAIIVSIAAMINMKDTPAGRNDNSYVQMKGMDPRLKIIVREYQIRESYSTGSYLTCPVCGGNYYKGYDFYTGFRNPVSRDDNLCCKGCEEIYWGLMAADKSGDHAGFEDLIHRKNGMAKH